MLPDNVLHSSNLSRDLGNFLKEKRYSKVALLADENTLAHCYPLVSDILDQHTVIKVKSGEEEKNLATCAYVWQAMTDMALDRHAVLIVLGGGVLGDMGGFCAATYKRGIDFILIPTTLLAQADASIGGKLGVDFNNLKNHIGVFQLPALTILHSHFLQTLPENELRSGFAEVIKHALISDAPVWASINAKPLAAQDWETLVKHSVAYKAWVTTEDPRETGLRKILNAGHTIGHALESFLLGHRRKIMHGEAVASGLIAEGWIANKRGMLGNSEFQLMAKYIVSVFGKTGFDANEVESIAALAAQDKKNKGNRILCVLLDGLGKARWDCEISLDEIKEALLFYRSFQM